MIAIVDRVRLDGTRASVRLTVFHSGVPVEEGFNPTSQETWEFPWNGQRWIRTKVASQRRPLPDRQNA